MTSEQHEIIEFITRRFGDTDSHWLDGNCYYFAVILTNRFPQLQIYYEPVLGHFLAGKDNIFYDATGLVSSKKIIRKPYLFSKLKNDDELYYNHILRDCVK